MQPQYLTARMPSSTHDSCCHFNDRGNLLLADRTIEVVESMLVRPGQSELAVQ
jgi:hypothetical protein